jgi:hypothetical protein
MCGKMRIQKRVSVSSCLSATLHGLPASGTPFFTPRNILFQTLSLFAARHAFIKLPVIYLVAMLVSAGAHAADTWLTITGDPANSANHYIQVNVAAIDVKDDLRTLPVRINRATLWTTAGDGIQFRSVVTEVQIDCTQQTARYVKAAFYTQPDFRGEPFRISTYAGDDIRPMIFKDIDDDPNARIIKAACSARNVTSN